jgi:hypothetical protein
MREFALVLMLIAGGFIIGLVFAFAGALAMHYVRRS